MLLIWSGFAATLAVSVLAAILRWRGVTRLSPSLVAAQLIARRRSTFLGLPLLLLLGGVLVPLLYRLAFGAVGRADAGTGFWLGCIHGVLAGFALWTIGGPDAPGLFGHRAGALTPLGVVILHALYGALLGYFYVLPAG